MMCGRFTLLSEREAIRRYFAVENNWESYTQSYNIAPTEKVLAIIYDGKMNRAGYMSWGLIPSWAKEKKFSYSMINARTETIDVKPSFKHLLQRKRCLIVADSFYEWQQTASGKVPHRIQLANKQLFAFAGLWDKWENGDERIFTCTMLTKDANEFMEPIHHRMPIMLEKPAAMEWLHQSFPTNQAVKSFALQVADPMLTSYPVSTYVNHAKNNDPLCIESI